VTGNSVVSAAKAPWVVLRAAAIPTAGLGVLAIVVCGLLRGGQGALGAAIGTLIVIAFFSAGQYALGRLLISNPHQAMTGALAIYLVKILVLFGFLAFFKNTTLFDSQCFAITIVVCTFGWLIAEVLAMGRTKMLYVEPVPSSTSPQPAPTMVPDDASSASATLATTSDEERTP
jgi:ATP synthase protein I